MNSMTIREAILTTVNTRQGVNGVDLVLNCMGLVNPFFEDKDYAFTLAELVSLGEVVELEYILPHMNYRLKSLYFPKGTKLYANEHTVHHDQTVFSNNSQGASIRPTNSPATRMGMGSIPSRWKGISTRFIQRFWRRTTAGHV